MDYFICENRKDNIGIRIFWNDWLLSSNNSETTIAGEENSVENDELISIIIPVYNVKSYLSIALDSVIAQTYSVLEIIIVDDGSTDGSADVCDCYAQKDDRIRVIHTNNKGLSSARNLGLSIAKGSFVSFIDSDDWIEPFTIEVMLNAALRTKASIVSGRSCREYVGETIHSPKREKDQYVYHGYDIYSAFAKGIINDVAWNKLYRVACFSNIMFPDGRNYEDVFTMWKLMRDVVDANGKVVALSEDLFHRRMRKSSISHTKSFKNIVDCWEAYHIKYVSVPEYHEALTTDCIMAVGRMWMNYSSFSDEDKTKSDVIIQEMVSFSRNHFQEIQKGNYAFRIKILNVLSQHSSSCVFMLCHFVNKMHIKLTNEDRKLFD